jgi:predicted membrane metal-binding protein
MYSWVVHYFLGNAPVWIWPFVAGGGCAIYFLAGFLGNLPQFKPYALFIKPIAFITFSFGVFMYGGAGVVAVYQAQIKEAEYKAQLAEQKSEASNKQLMSDIKQAQQQTRDIKSAIKTDIQANAKQLDGECRVSDAAIEIHNDAAENKKPKVTVTSGGKAVK